MNPESVNTLLLGFLGLGQTATFIVILRLGVQYGRDSTELREVRKDVDELRPVVGHHAATLGQHEWRLDSHDARHNTTEATVEKLRMRSEP